MTEEKLFQNYKTIHQQIGLVYIIKFTPNKHKIKSLTQQKQKSN